MSLQEKPQGQPQETMRHDNDENEPASTTSDTDHSSPQIDQVATKKSLAFWLTFVAVLVNLFLYALDATTLAVATPVSHEVLTSRRYY